jgi:hypothetical protein
MKGLAPHGRCAIIRTNNRNRADFRTKILRLSSAASRRSRRSSQDRGGDVAGAFGAAVEDAVDLGGVGREAGHLGGDRRELGHGEVGEAGLEGRELLAGVVADHLFGRQVRETGVDVDEVAGLGPPLEPVEIGGQGLGVGAGLADLLRDGVGVVGHVDPAHVRGIGFRHLLRAVAQAHHPGGGALDHRFGDGEELHPVVVVELDRDVAGQLQVLLLVLAHGDVGGVVDEDVGGHQRGIGEEPDAGVLAVLAGLVLPLGHALHPAHPGDAVEDPGELGVFGHADWLKRMDFSGSMPLAMKPAQSSRVARCSLAGSCQTVMACRSTRQ